MKNENNLDAKLLLRKTVADSEKHPKPSSNLRLKIGLGSIYLLSCGACLILANTPTEYETMVELIPDSVEVQNLNQSYRIPIKQNSFNKDSMRYDEEKNVITIEKYLMKENMPLEDTENGPVQASFLSDKKMIETYKYHPSNMKKEYNVFGTCLNCDELSNDMITEKELEFIKKR